MNSIVLGFNEVDRHFKSIILTHRCRSTARSTGSIFSPLPPPPPWHPAYWRTPSSFAKV